MQEILQQLTWIKSATSPHDVVDRVMAAVGFTDDDYVCIAMFDDDAPVMAHRVPPSFLEVFVERRLYEHCPGIEHARRVSTPFNYFDAPVSSAEGRAVFNVIQGFGIEDAVIIPIHNTCGPVGSGWFAVGRSEGKQQLQGLMPVLEMLTKHAFSRLQDLMQPKKSSDVRLSEREKEVLYWSACGMTARQIGEKMRRSPKTVEWYVRQAMTKLGAASRCQAVALAIRNGSITL